MVIVENLAVTRGGKRVLDGIDLHLEPGKIHALIGPNGTGKTTFLRALFGDLPLAAGTITHGERRLFAGRSGARALKAWRGCFSYLPQDTGVDIALSVLETVVLGRLDRLSLHIDDETLHLALRRLCEVGIADLAQHDIATLSGGQRQMALFAQILMREPSVMLLDEPVSALDLKHQIALLDLVARETRDKGWVTVVVLHDLNLACQYADTLLVMAGGALQAMGPPHRIVTPSLIAKTYGVEVEVLRDRRGHPVIQPRSPQLSEIPLKNEGIAL